MSALVSGYEYDIFISYRHNDNLDGWVTDFVESLEKELRGTLKENLTIYFDKSPHDGLLETYNVDKSLEGKLKCLIFIPVISQTYCDTKSFAWQYEFCAFNKLSKEDELGRDIKLSNGNVASRILPIKIHDLDIEDKMLLEKELGGVLRAIEFIYKEPGVNRPMKPLDNKNDNQNKTEYRNQVNKAANAIKDLIPILSGKKSFSKSLFSDAWDFNINMGIAKPEIREKSIAVLPFVNLSHDPEQEYFSDGLTDDILYSLAQIKELKVASRASSFQFKNRIDLRQVGETLRVRTALEGSVRKQGDRIRVTAQLTEINTGFQLWSERFDRKVEDVFAIQDEIATVISERLVVEWVNPKPKSQSSIDTAAYEMFSRGKYIIGLRYHFPQAINFFSEAVKIQPDYAEAYSNMALAYVDMAIYTFMPSHEALEKARAAAERALQLDPLRFEALTALAFVKSFNDWKFDEAEDLFKKSIDLNPAFSLGHVLYCLFLAFTRPHDKRAMQEARNAIETDPLNPAPYYMLGVSYFVLSRFDECIKACNKSLEINPLILAASRYKWLSLIELKDISSAKTILISIAEKFNRPQMLLVDMARIFEMENNVEAIRNYLDELIHRSQNEYISEDAIAGLYIRLGEFEKANALLEIAFQKRNFWTSCMGFMKIYYQRVLDKTILPELWKKMGLIEK